MARKNEKRRKRGPTPPRGPAPALWSPVPVTVRPTDRWVWTYYVCEPGERYTLPDRTILTGTLVVVDTMDGKEGRRRSGGWHRTDRRRFTDEEAAEDAREVLREGPPAFRRDVRVFMVRRGELSELAIDLSDCPPRCEVCGGAPDVRAVPVPADPSQFPPSRPDEVAAVDLCVSCATELPPGWRLEQLSVARAVAPN